MQSNKRRRNLQSNVFTPKMFLLKPLTLRPSSKKNGSRKLNWILDTRSAKLADDTYEVVLALTVTATVEGQTAFLAEVQQAGIFTIGNLPEPQLAHTIGAFCPTTLFPYAREAVSSLVNRGSFPQLNLAPVNFDALFASYVQKRAAESEAAAPAGSETH